jgi:hypothetical protein
LQQEQPKGDVWTPYGLFRKGDKALADSITRRANKRSSTRKQGISINLTHFATEADCALQCLETAEGMALDYMQGVCVTNESKDNQASCSSKKDAADQPHQHHLLLVEDHSNNVIPQQQEPEVQHADVVSFYKNMCTAAKLFDDDEQEEDDQHGGANNSNYVRTNENTSINYYGATGCHGAVSTASATSSMTSSDDDEQSSSRHHVQQPAVDVDNRPAIHQTSAVCWPQQQLGHTVISFEEGKTFLSSLQKQVEDFMRKSAPSAHHQQPTTSACEPTEDKGRPAAAATKALHQTLNSVYCSLQQAECEILLGLRYMESTRGNIRIDERDALLASADAPLLLHHQSPHPRPPPHEEPATIHFPVSIHDYQQEHSENFRSPPPTIFGEQELEPLTAEEDNDDYSTTTDQAAVPAAVLLYMLNSGNATTRAEAV